MQFRQPKKLIEVALPLDAINAASAREKSIRHGHPSTLHLWWARRPLAAARAVIFAQMVDDPSAWPELFPTEADQEAERQRLFRLIEQLVQWENTTNEDLLRQAREEIWKSWRRTCAAVRSEERGARSERSAGRWERSEERAEREERGKGGEEREERGVDEDGGRLALFDPDKLPAFHDPFAGGGALPLEAQRLGLEAYASDLNPVAVLINKAMIEIPPKFAGMPPVGGRSEGREVRSEGREVRSEGREVRSEIGERGVRSEIGEEDALSGNDPLAESDGGSARSVSAGAAPAQGGNLRDALADHTGSNLGSGEHSGGLDPRIQQGQGAVPGGRPGVPGGSGDIADALRGPGLVPDARNEPAALDAGRGQSHVDNDAAETSRGLTSHSSLLFPLSYKGAQGLAEDVRYYGRWMRDEAEKRIGHLYPKIEITAEMVRERPDLKPYLGQKLTVIAWLWARTVKSPNPAFAHVDVPLASTFILSSKPGKEAYVEPVIESRSEEIGNRSEEIGNSDERLFPTSSFLSPTTGYRFTVRVGKPPEWARNGTKLARGANFRCLMSGSPIEPSYIYSEANAGRMGARLMAIVAEGERGRVYLPPTPEHEAIARSAQPEWKPDVAMPENPRWFSPPLYGLTTYGDLFTSRQLAALTTFADLVGEAIEKVKQDAQAAGMPDDGIGPAHGGAGATAYAQAVGVYLAFGVSRLANRLATLCMWNRIGEKIEQVFARQAIPMIWDFAEANALSDSTGGWTGSLEWVPIVLETFRITTHGCASQSDAAVQSVREGKIISTDPPYYDNIGYAALSDFFYVWLRRTIGDLYPDLFGTILVPKEPDRKSVV